MRSKSLKLLPDYVSDVASRHALGIALIVCATALSGCAVYQPAPLLYDGSGVYPSYTAAPIGVDTVPVYSTLPYYAGPPVSLDLWFYGGYPDRYWGAYRHGYWGGYRGGYRGWHGQGYGGRGSGFGHGYGGRGPGFGHGGHGVGGGGGGRHR